MDLKKTITNHYLLAFFITLFVSLGLLITSFILPPKGVIDPSILAGVGEIFAWPTLAFAAKAIDDGKTAKLKKGETELSIGDGEK